MFLIAAGEIPAFAVDVMIAGPDGQAAGHVLMVAGDTARVLISFSGTAAALARRSS